MRPHRRLSGGLATRAKGHRAMPHEAGAVAEHLPRRLAATFLVLLTAATGARVVAVRLTTGFDRINGRGQRIVIITGLLFLVVLAFLLALMETVGLRIKASYHGLADLLESCDFPPPREQTHSRATLSYPIPTRHARQFARPFFHRSFVTWTPAYACAEVGPRRGGP